MSDSLEELNREDTNVTFGLETQSNKKTWDLLDRIWSKIGSDAQANSLIGGFTRMTRRALNATAAALFLVDEENQTLILKFSSGRVEKRPVRFKVDAKAGIPGLVTTMGKSVMTNAADGNPRYNRLANQVYGFPVKSIICVPLIVQRKIIGVIEATKKVGSADFGPNCLQELTGAASTVALAIENVRLNDVLEKYYKSTIQALVSLADAKEAMGMGHSRRVAEYAMMAANRLNIPDSIKHSIEYAAILHDIGKLAIPDEILNKSGSLTENDRKIMNQHSEIGYNLLRSIPFLEEAASLVLFHHERFDGNGYPHGAKARAIPVGARIIAVADAFDNMTTPHAYRSAMEKKAALVELNRHVREQFCPVAVKAFFAGYVNSVSAEKK